MAVETFLAAWARRAGRTKPQIAPRTPLLALLERPVGAPWPPYFEVWGLFGSLSAPCTRLGAFQRPFVAKLALICPPRKDKITSITVVLNNKQCKMCPEPYVTCQTSRSPELKYLCPTLPDTFSRVASGGTGRRPLQFRHQFQPNRAKCCPSTVW